MSKSYDNVYEGPITYGGGGVVVGLPSNISDKPFSSSFDKILDTQGSWMIHVHPRENFPCNVCGAIPGSGEGQGNCSTCLGTGYRIKLSRKNVVLSKGRRTFSNESDAIPGAFSDSKHRLFVGLDNSVASRDLIMEVTWNTNRPSINIGEPIEILHVYSVDTAEILYFKGKPCYIMAFLDNIDHHLDPIRKALKVRQK